MIPNMVCLLCVLNDGSILLQLADPEILSVRLLAGCRRLHNQSRALLRGASKQELKDLEGYTVTGLCVQACAAEARVHAVDDDGL